MLLLHLFILFVSKVARMDDETTLNTSGTDNQRSNAQKCENSPLLSKERGGMVVHIRAVVVKSYTRDNSVIFHS